MTTDIDFATITEYQRYKLMASLIVPRPIALVTTRGVNGVVNAAPFSMFNMLGEDPPILMISINKLQDGRLKDTAANILANREFVVHIADEPMAEQMHRCGDDLPVTESELSAVGLTTQPARAVKPPRIVEAPVAFECRWRRRWRPQAGTSSSARALAARARRSDRPRPLPRPAAELLFPWLASAQASTSARAIAFRWRWPWRRRIDRDRRDRMKVIRHVRKSDGTAVDVLVNGATIASIVPAGQAPRELPALVEGRDQMLLPALVESHVHFDKTLWGLPWRPNSAGPTRNDRIANEQRLLANFDVPIADRAGPLIEHCIARGSLYFRSHVDVQLEWGLRHVEAMLALRERYRDVIDLQLVAFPQGGMLRPAGHGRTHARSC